MKLVISLLGLLLIGFSGTAFVDSEPIELIPDESDLNYLKGFRISVAPLNDENSRFAYELANRFTNYLSIITGIIVDHKRPTIRKRVWLSNKIGLF